MATTQAFWGNVCNEHSSPGESDLALRGGSSELVTPHSHGREGGEPPRAHRPEDSPPAPCVEGGERGAEGEGQHPKPGAGGGRPLSMINAVPNLVVAAASPRAARQDSRCLQVAGTRRTPLRQIWAICNRKAL